MQVTTPTGRTYAVRRRWLPWRQWIPVDTVLAVTLLAGIELVLRVVLMPVWVLLRLVRALPWVLEVRDLGARKERAVVSRERVRGWTPSQKRIEALARDLRQQYVDPDAPGFPVIVSRSSVAMGDDATDNTVVFELDDRAVHPTLTDLITAIRNRGRFVSIAGAPTTWVLRESTPKRNHGRPLAIFVLDRNRNAIDVHPVGNLSYRVAREGHFHLEYLLTQSVERTREMIAADPRGKKSLRDRDHT